MNREALPSGLYRMHGRMLASSSLWGLLVGMAGVLLMKQTNPSMPFARAIGSCVIVGLLSWLFSLLSPMSFQLYKYVLPMAMPLLGAALLGISGMGIGYAVAFFLRIIGDVRRLIFMVMAGAQRPDSTQYHFVRDVIIRPAIGFAAACTAIALTLHKLGVLWGSPGSGEFAAIIALPESRNLVQLPAFCLMWGFSRQLFESGVDIWTTPAFWQGHR
jgi:hypothetical protein